MRFLPTRFAKWQLPDAFVFVDELPHTSTGKLLKEQLAAAVWRVAMGAVSPARAVSQFQNSR